jgi:hypothetical protein
MSTLTDRRAGLSASTALKAACRVGTTANITLSGYQTIDGVLPTSSQHPDLRRILVKDQDDAAENGIYVMDTGTWARAKDFDSINDIRKGTLVYVNEGTTLAGLAYRVTSSVDPDDFTIDEDDITFGVGNLTSAAIGVSVQAWSTILDQLALGGDTARTALGLGTTNGVAFTSLTLTATTASSSAGGTFAALYSNDGAALASGDRLGAFILGGAKDGASSLVNAAAITAFAAEAWGASAAGADLAFEVAAIGATTRTERMRIGAGAIVVNEAGNDYDVRMEGDTAPRLFFLDASADLVTFSRNVATPTAPTAGAALHVVQVDGIISRIVNDSFGTALGSKFTARTARGTAASPSATQLDDELGSWSGLGYGATAYADGGRADYKAIADGNWTDSSHPTRISFWTTPSGSTTVTEIIRLNNAGLTGFGTTNPGARVHAAYAGTLQFRGTNSSASGASSGAFIGLYEDDGAACASGDRLGGFFLGGANDGASTLINSAAVTAFASEAWGGSAAGTELRFETCAAGATTRTTHMYIHPTGDLSIGTATAATISGTGFKEVSHDLGTVTTGTTTPDAANGNKQHYVNGGAHTLAPPAASSTIEIEITNNASAGAITTSGFTKVGGDSLTTTNGHKFACCISKTQTYSYLLVTALQ